MPTAKQYLRGEIYMAKLPPPEEDKEPVRTPVMIVSNNTGNLAGPSVIVIEISSCGRYYMPNHVRLHESVTDLPQDSVAMTEEIYTLDKSALGEYIGIITDRRLLSEINFALRVSMGEIESFNARPFLRCFCRKCASQYYDDPHYVIYRKHRGEKPKDSCELCHIRRGLTYVLMEKHE